MLLSLEYKQLVEELDYEVEHSSPDKIEVVNILLDIRKKQPFKDNKKLQRLINHYAVERDNMVILKPSKV